MTRSRRPRPAGTGWTSAPAPGTAEGRPSEVRLDRLVLMPDADVRREGAALDRAIFDQVLAEARKLHAIS